MGTIFSEKEFINIQLKIILLYLKKQTKNPGSYRQHGFTWINPSPLIHTLTLPVADSGPEEARPGFT